MSAAISTDYKVDTTHKKPNRTTYTVTNPNNPQETLVMYDVRGRISYSGYEEGSALAHSAAVAWAKAQKAKRLK